VSAPVLPTLLWHGWGPAWTVDVEAGLALLLYTVGVRRARSPWPARRTLAFGAGVACMVVALQSGIDGFDDRMLSVHMVQHLLLLELAPLLLLASRPGLLFLRAAPRSARPWLVRRLDTLRPVTHPVACLLVFSVIVIATHLPGFYDATLRHPALHDAEHVLYLLAGVLMWWPLLDADPLARRRLNGMTRLAYLIAAMVPMTLLGAYLNRHTSLVYAGYAAPARALGISAVVDQQQAGAIMWVLGSTLMIAAGLWQAMAAMVEEERRMVVRERAAAVGVGLERRREP
jgi:putative copper resistance protein D